MEDWSKLNVIFPIVEQSQIGNSSRKKNGHRNEMTEEQLLIPEFQDPVYPDELLDYLASSVDDSIQTTLSGQSTTAGQNFLSLDNYNQQNSFVQSVNQVSGNDILQSSNVDPNLEYQTISVQNNELSNFVLPAFDNGPMENFSLDFLISNAANNGSKVVQSNSEIIFGEIQDQFRQSERTLGGVQSGSDDVIGRQLEEEIISLLDPEQFVLPNTDQAVQSEIPSYDEVFGNGQPSQSVMEEFPENILSLIDLESSVSSPATSTRSDFVMDDEVLVRTRT